MTLSEPLNIDSEAFGASVADANGGRLLVVLNGVYAKVGAMIQDVQMSDRTLFESI